MWRVFYTIWQACSRLTFHMLVTKNKKIPQCQQVHKLQSAKESMLWVSGSCSGPAMGSFECWLYVIVFGSVLFAEGGDFWEQTFSPSCLLTHKSWQRLGPRLRTHCLSKCLRIPVCVGSVRCCFTDYRCLQEVGFYHHSFPHPPLRKPHIAAIDSKINKGSDEAC